MSVMEKYHSSLCATSVKCYDIASIGRIRNAKVVGSTPALGNPFIHSLTKAFEDFFH